MAIEKALGIDAPPRAMHVRTILIEFSRMTSHLAFLSWLPWRVADFSRSGRVHHLLDTAHDLWEGFCGNRIHPMTCRIGGTAHDVTPVFAASLNTWCMHAAALSDELRSLLDGPAGACTRGMAVIPADAVAPFGLSGPLARASGVPMDLRCPNAARRRTSRSETTTSWRTEDSRGAPRHLAYDQVNFPVVDAPTGGMPTAGCRGCAPRCASPRIWSRHCCRAFRMESWRLDCQRRSRYRRGASGRSWRPRGDGPAICSTLAAPRRRGAWPCVPPPSPMSRCWNTCCPRSASNSWNRQSPPWDGRWATSTSSGQSGQRKGPRRISGGLERSQCAVTAITPGDAQPTRPHPGLGTRHGTGRRSSNHCSRSRCHRPWEPRHR